MKNAKLFSLFSLLFILALVSCRKEGALTSPQQTPTATQVLSQEEYFSSSDLQKVEGLYANLSRQERLAELGSEEMAAFAEDYFARVGALEFQLSVDSDIKPIISSYVNNNLVWATQGAEVDEAALQRLRETVRQHDEISSDWKVAFLSQIQLQQYLANSAAYQQYRSKKNQNRPTGNRHDCDCTGAFEAFDIAQAICDRDRLLFRWLAAGACNRANELRLDFQDCLLAEPCPAGSVYDGANCYFGIHAPAGSNPFVYNGGLYWRPGPGNSCCCGSWFDGANCYVRNGGPGAFVYNNAFYATPNCEVE